MDQTVTLLGSSETARRLRVHEFTVRRWATEGKLPCVRDSSGKRLFLASDVELLVQARRAKQ